jgi:hypothetical protein
MGSLYSIKPNHIVVLESTFDELSFEQQKEIRLKQLNKLTSKLQAYSQQTVGDSEPTENLLTQMESMPNLIEEPQNPRIAFEKQS